MFKVIIAGGRDFDNYDYLVKSCNHVLQNKSNIEIVSGTAKGADKLGEEYAIENKYSLKSFPAPWKDLEGKPENEIGTNKNGFKYWKLAGHVRNKQMAEYADALIVFWDGESSGSKNMIEIARKNGLPIKVFRYIRK